MHCTTKLHSKKLELSLDLHSKLVIIFMLCQADFPSTANLPEVLLECLVDLLNSGLQVWVPLVLQQMPIAEQTHLQLYPWSMQSSPNLHLNIDITTAWGQKCSHQLLQLEISLNTIWFACALQQFIAHRFKALRFKSPCQETHKLTQHVFQHQQVRSCISAATS